MEDTKCQIQCLVNVNDVLEFANEYLNYISLEIIVCCIFLITCYYECNHSLLFFFFIIFVSICLSKCMLAHLIVKYLPQHILSTYHKIFSRKSIILGSTILYKIFYIIQDIFALVYPFELSQNILQKTNPKSGRIFNFYLRMRDLLPP